MTKYFIRIDDVCPTMNHEAFKRIMDSCDAYGIHPILGIIPDNKDTSLMVLPQRESFWQEMRTYHQQGALIAQHGFQHIYEKTQKTEFAGLPYTDQYQKLKRGHEILKAKLGFTPTWFMAPAHSFDTTTCDALKNLGFTHITDGFALYPFIKDGLTWIPQQLWRPVLMPFGTWTICLHPNTMKETDIQELLAFINQHAQAFKHVSLAPKQSLFNLPMRILWNAILRYKNL